jgi:hypothetical protein
MLKIFRERRRRRRQRQDPAKQLGKAAGAVIVGVILSGLKTFLKK